MRNIHNIAREELQEILGQKIKVRTQHKIAKKLRPIENALFTTDPDARRTSMESNALTTAST